MVKISTLGLAGMLALGACGTALPPVPQSYRQSIVVAGIGYGAASRVALAYAQQPRCSVASKPPPLCADLETVVTLGRASKGAEAALKVAEAVPADAPQATRDAAMAAVLAALADFEAYTKTASGK